MLDKTFAAEVKSLLVDDSRETKFAFLKRLDDARKDFSNTNVRRTFNDSLSKHGRALTAVCVAATLDVRRERIDYWGWSWAREVLALLPPNISKSNLERGVIDDGIHPTAICEYAESLIKQTTEETVVQARKTGRSV